MFQISVIKHTLFMIAVAGIISTMPDTSEAHTELIKPLDTTSVVLSKSAEYSDIPRRIIIPSLNIDIEVKESQIVNGTWEVHTDAAGYGLGSSFLDDPFGNPIIFAHARQGLFRDLSQISETDKIIILSDTYEYIYEVLSAENILPNELNKVKSNGAHRLTLFTCEGPRDEFRLIVKATRVSVTSLDRVTLFTNSEPSFIN